MVLNEKPHGIIITFPVQFLLDLSADMDPNIYTEVGNSDTYTYTQATQTDRILYGYKECIRQIETVRKDPDNNWWWHSIGTKPTHEVLWCYIVILGKIRYKARVGCWEPGGEKEFNDGRKRTAKNWLMLCDFVKAPQDIERKGFQGFRYTDELF